MEVITEEWLKGIFFYEVMRYEDGVARRYHRRSARGVPHEFRPGHDAEELAFPDNDGEQLADDEPLRGGSIDKRGRFGNNDTVEFVGASVPSSIKAPRHVPAPPVAGGRSAPGMAKVRQLGDALLDGEAPASLDSRERPPLINPRPHRGQGVPDKLPAPAPVDDGCGGLLSLVRGITARPPEGD